MVQERRTAKAAIALLVLSFFLFAFVASPLLVSEYEFLENSDHPLVTSASFLGGWSQQLYLVMPSYCQTGFSESSSAPFHFFGTYQSKLFFFILQHIFFILLLFGVVRLRCYKVYELCFHWLLSLDRFLKFIYRRDLGKFGLC